MEPVAIKLVRIVIIICCFQERVGAKSLRQLVFPGIRNLLPPLIVPTTGHSTKHAHAAPHAHPSHHDHHVPTIHHDTPSHHTTRLPVILEDVTEQSILPGQTIHEIDTVPPTQQAETVKQNVTVQLSQRSQSDENDVAEPSAQKTAESVKSVVEQTAESHKRAATESLAESDKQKTVAIKSQELHHDFHLQLSPRAQGIDHVDVSLKVSEPLHLQPPPPNGYGIFQLENGEDKLYRIGSKQPKTLEEGEILCQNFNDEQNLDKEDSKQEYFYTLLTIQSGKEQTFAQKFIFDINGVHESVWLGLKDSGGVLRWNGKTEQNFTNWAEGQEQLKEQMCVQMDFRPAEKAGLWTRVDCSTKNVIVCEALKITATEVLKNMFSSYKLQLRRQWQQMQNAFKAQNITLAEEKKKEREDPNVAVLLKSVRDLEHLVTDLHLDQNLEDSTDQTNTTSKLESRRLEEIDSLPESKISGVDESLRELQNNITDLTVKNNITNQTIALLQRSTNDLTKQEEKIEETITDLEEEIKRLKGRANGRKQNNSYLPQTVKELDQKVRELSMRMDLTGRNFAALQRNVSDQRSRNEPLLQSRSNSGQKLQKRNMSNRNQGRVRMISEGLEQKIGELGDNVKILQRKITDLKEKNEDVEHTNAALEKVVRDLKKTNDVSEVKNSALKQRVRDVERRIEAALRLNMITKQKAANMDRQNFVDPIKNSNAIDQNFRDPKPSVPYLSRRRHIAPDSEVNDYYVNPAKEDTPPKKYDSGSGIHKNTNALQNVETGSTEQDVRSSLNYKKGPGNIGLQRKHLYPSDESFLKKTLRDPFRNQKLTLSSHNMEIVLSVQKLSFFEASQSCQKIHQGNLLVIHDQETQDRAAELLDKIAEFEPVWIGLNGTIFSQNKQQPEDTKTSYYMHWANGLTYNVHSFNSFVKGHPDINGHACVHMDKTGLVGMPYGWAATEDCNRRFRYFCQFAPAKPDTEDNASNSFTY